jgi:hypothetical protein
VSALVDSALPPELRAALLDEIRDHLPAFLRKDSSEQHDPIGDVRELLNLDDRDLNRVLSVHGCLDESIIAFGKRLAEGMRNPLASSSRPAEVSQAVRGPVDWSATLARRSMEAGNATQYVIRSPRRLYDNAENRALVWVLDRLRLDCKRALGEKPDPEMFEGEPPVDAWANRIRRLAAQVERARGAEWLREIEAEPPAERTMQRLHAARSSFYREDLTAAIARLKALEGPDEKVLVEVLSERYFEPAATWMIFEICVALRLARAFAKVSDRPRRSRLLVGSERAAFASYLLPDGSEVSLLYQAWPKDAGPSQLGETGERHVMKVGASKPDLFVVRAKGGLDDVLLLELKASVSPSYLKDGLVKLLGYLCDRPELWKRKPAGWLVAPRSEAFVSGPMDEMGDLWVVDADAVAVAAVERIAPDVSPAAGRPMP